MTSKVIDNFNQANVKTWHAAKYMYSKAAPDVKIKSSTCLGTKFPREVS